ncbi:MAG: RluA family pseudouridine synthase [Chloroflexota bacterium]|nr:RluA family pseudouridine synthase [Chloroflexota bacterium]
MTDAAILGDRVVSGEANGGRLDLAVSAVAGISRAHAQRLISDGRATVDGRRGRASDRLRGGELIRVELSAPADPSLRGEAIPLRIAYEDAAMLIVDKPAGLVVHPSHGHASGTLVNALVGRAEGLGEQLGSIAGVGRPGIVHRLDKQTSGLIVVAKTDAAQASLMQQFGARSVEKEYLALVRGETPAPRGRIEAPVGRDPRDRQRMAVVAGGRAAVTEYESLGSGAGCSLVALHPLTGRTHQLRAHLAYLGLPIAGDMRYGGGIGPGGLERQFLHAARITLDRPLDGRRLTAWSELPDDLAASLAASGIVTDRLPAGVGAALLEAPR